MEEEEEEEETGAEKDGAEDDEEEEKDDEEGEEGDKVRAQSLLLTALEVIETVFDMLSCPT